MRLLYQLHHNERRGRYQKKIVIIFDIIKLFNTCVIICIKFTPNLLPGISEAQKPTDIKGLITIGF
jgi:hypothetical protein